MHGLRSTSTCSLSLFLRLVPFAVAALLPACDASEEAQTLGVGEVEVTLAGTVRSVSYTHLTLPTNREV